MKEAAVDKSVPVITLRRGYECLAHEIEVLKFR
jgi:hypothetical protein